MNTTPKLNEAAEGGSSPVTCSPFLSIDAVKAIGEVMDGQWHLMRPNLKKASAIWELHWARILEYRYLPPIPKERHQRMEVRLHNRVRRYWANAGVLAHADKRLSDHEK
jgi:hypothetical protein